MEGEEMDEQNFNNQNDSNNNYQDYTSNAQYQQPSYQQPQEPKQTNVLAIVGMVLGIISILAGCCGWYSLILAIPGLICSILSRKQSKTGMAVAGIVCSIVGIVLGIIMTIFAFGILAAIGSSDYEDILRYYESM